MGHLRPELNFDSLEALIEAINNDINQAKTLLDDPDALKYKNHSFFTDKFTTNGDVPEDHMKTIKDGA